MFGGIDQPKAAVECGVNIYWSLELTPNMVFPFVRAALLRFASPVIGRRDSTLC